MIKVFFSMHHISSNPHRLKFGLLLPVIHQLLAPQCRDIYRGCLFMARSSSRHYSNHCLAESSNGRLNEDIQTPSFQSCTDLRLYGNPVNFPAKKPKSIFESRSLQHWYKNWQEKRRTKLTASTFAQAVGFWRRRRTQLWLEKIGAIEPFSNNLATCWSNTTEEEALERYKLMTGHTVFFPDFQVYGDRNPNESWLGASPDGVAESHLYSLPSRGVLEVKCPLFGGGMRISSYWRRIPIYCIPQAQGLMEIMDKEWMDFYVWTPGGSSLFRLYRDVEYWEVLKLALSDFWWNHVQPAKEQCRKLHITNPLIELRSLRPSPRHELCSHIVCESKRVADNSELLWREINGVRVE